MKKIFFIITYIIKVCLLLIGLFVVLLNTFLGMGQVNVFYPDICTSFTKDFNKNNYWTKIVEKQPKSEVIKYLGSPFKIDTLNQNDCTNREYKHFYRMCYSKENYSAYFRFAWCGFYVYLDENQNVRSKEEKWWED